MERHYTLTLQLNGQGDRISSPIANDTNGSDNEKSQGLLSKEQAKAFAAGFAAYKTVKSFATQIINYEVSMVELRSGSREMQEKATFINEVVQKGVGIMETVTAGAAVGGGWGALIGLGVGLIKTAIGYAQQANTLREQAALEKETLTRNYLRAGTMGSRWKV